MHACIYSFDKQRYVENYLLNTSPRGFWGSGWILLSSITPWEEVVSIGTCEGSSVVIRGVLCGGSVGLTVIGWGVVGGGGFVTDVMARLVVTGTYLVVGFGVGRVVVLGAGWVGPGTGRVVGPGIGRAVGTGVGWAVGLVTGLSVTKSGTCSSLRSCAFSINNPTHYTMPPSGRVQLALDMWYGPGGSIITRGITAKRIKMGPKQTSQPLTPET